MNAQEKEKETLGYALLMFISSLLFIFELAGGYVAWSATVLMDAWHVLGDTLVYYLSLKALRSEMSTEGRYKQAICNSTVVAGIAGVNIVLSVLRTTLFPMEHTNPSAMFWVSLVGLGVNCVMMGILFYYGLRHDHGHNHEDDEHAHQHERTHGHHEKSARGFIKRAAFLHTIGDIFISLFGVGTAVFILQTGGHPTYIDMFASVVAGLLIVFFALRARREAQQELRLLVQTNT